MGGRGGGLFYKPMDGLMHEGTSIGIRVTGV